MAVYLFWPNEGPPTFPLCLFPCLPLPPSGLLRAKSRVHWMAWQLGLVGNQTHADELLQNQRSAYVSGTIVEVSDLRVIYPPQHTARRVHRC